MKFQCRRQFGRQFARPARYAMGTLLVCLLATPWARSQSTMAGAKPQMSEDAFKNVQVLRGIPVNEFMGVMGFFSASLNMNCIDCHAKESAGNWDHYADDTPLKQTARRMVLMENLINRADFGMERKVTCYTCHRGYQIPAVIPSLADQYGPPPAQDPDLVEVLPGAADTSAAAEKILDKYIQAVGGAPQLAKVTSFTAKGSYNGFDTEFQKVATEISAKAPNMMTVTNKLSAGASTTTYNGSEAWIASVNEPVPMILLSGGDLDSARLDAGLAFPGTLKQTLSKWHTGFPAVMIDKRPVTVVEATTAGGSQVKLFFDKDSGLLLRSTRFIDTVVGHIPVHVDYSDYRAVSGIKMPFHWQLTWVDGQSTTDLTEIKANAPVAADKFVKPASR